MTIRLVLADDHARYREVLAGLLASQPGLQVVAQAGDAEAALLAILACPPASVEAPSPLVLLLDVEMAQGGGVAAARAVRRARSDVRLLALSMHEEPAFVSAMSAAGCAGYALKSEPLQILVHAIREVAAGRRYERATGQHGQCSEDLG